MLIALGAHLSNLCHRLTVLVKDLVPVGLLIAKNHGSPLDGPGHYEGWMVQRPVDLQACIQTAYDASAHT